MVELMTDQFPLRKDSIEELEGHRNRAIEMARQGFLLTQEASKASAFAAPFVSYAGLGTTHEINGHRGYSDLPDYLVAVRKHVDKYAWQSLLNHSGMRNLMDATAYRQFSEQLEKNPPEFTGDNITSTFMGLAADAPMILERSIVTVFDKLRTRREHKTNGAFGIGPKIILTSAVSTYGWNSYGYTREMVRDMDRMFHVLDGKKPPDNGDLADAIGDAIRKKEKLLTTEYFECKLFMGNGNLHMKFTRPDLVTKVNRILSKHKGVTLPDDRMPAR
jgi:hypothetical protein